MQVSHPLVAALAVALHGPVHAEDHAGHAHDGHGTPALESQDPGRGPEDHPGHTGHTDHHDHHGHEGVGHSGHASLVGIAHADHAAHQDHAATGVTGSHDHSSHDHGSILGGHHHHGSGSSIAATIGVLAATYDARVFAGDYQGMTVGGRWSRGRFSVAAAVPAYRLQKNGRVVSGIGDVMVHGHAMLLGRGRLSTGVMAMASAPTGDGDQGLGMGHVMLMGDVWGAYTTDRVAITGTFGYAAAAASGGATAHAEHGGGGMWPLVEPMNASELTFGGGGMIALARTLATGARLWGATPTGDGTTRLSSAWRVAWREGRVETSAELQGGLVGDPFGVRGVIETSIQFR